MCVCVCVYIYIYIIYIYKEREREQKEGKQSPERQRGGGLLLPLTDLVAAFGDVGCKTATSRSLTRSIAYKRSSPATFSAKRSQEARHGSSQRHIQRKRLNCTAQKTGIGQYRNSRQRPNRTASGRSHRGKVGYLPSFRARRSPPPPSPPPAAVLLRRSFVALVSRGGFPTRPASTFSVPPGDYARRTECSQRAGGGGGGEESRTHTAGGH